MSDRRTLKYLLLLLRAIGGRVAGDAVMQEILDKYGGADR